MEKPFAFREIAMPHPNPRNEYVTYGRRLQPEMNFESDDLERLYLDHRKGLIETAIEECAEYLDADDWMDEDVFPCVKEMTGEWYLASVDVRREGGEAMAQIYLHFLGRCSEESMSGEKDDYLGIEALFVYDSDRGEFGLDGLNTDAI